MRWRQHKIIYRSSCHHQHGFSLLEMLVYLAIVITVTVAAVALLLALGGVVQRYQAETALMQTNTSVVEQLLLDIRAAEDVNNTASVLNDPSGQLVLTLPSEQVTYTITGQRIERQDADGARVLSGDRVQFNEFEVQVFPAGIAELVTVSLVSEATFRTGTSTRAYTAGAVTRASYE